MIKDSVNATRVELDFSISKGKTIDSIVKFLDEKLPSFSKNITKNLTSEDDISQDCCIYLAREARNELFMFHFQYKYLGGKRSSDLSIISAERYSSKDPLFIIEAKRLPTPGTGRLKEYVEGNLGGIERFKRGLHGNNLMSSAMLGYVQKENFDHWLDQVNSWITSLASTNQDATIHWKHSEVLEFTQKIKGVNKYLSVHSRSSNDLISLNHYWINLTR